LANAQPLCRAHNLEKEHRRARKDLHRTRTRPPPTDPPGPPPPRP
ncbi:hypothetical protein CLV63_104323, partial [Murinocardiopsis flavida]